MKADLSASFKVIKLVAEVVTFEISLESLSHFAIVVFLDPFTGTSIRQVLPFAPLSSLLKGASSQLIFCKFVNL